MGLQHNIRRDWLCSFNSQGPKKPKRASRSTFLTIILKFDHNYGPDFFYQWLNRMLRILMEAFKCEILYFCLCFWVFRDTACQRKSFVLTYRNSQTGVFLFSIYTIFSIKFSEQKIFSAKDKPEEIFRFCSMRTKKCTFSIDFYAFSNSAFHGTTGFVFSTSVLIDIVWGVESQSTTNTWVLFIASSFAEPTTLKNTKKNFSPGTSNSVASWKHQILFLFCCLNKDLSTFQIAFNGKTSDFDLPVAFWLVEQPNSWHKRWLV